MGYGSGKVGIGTLAPAETLDVNGTLRVSGSYSGGPRTVIENTGNASLTLAAHTGNGVPVTFGLLEDSTTSDNLGDYGMLALKRRNMTADGAGSNLFFEGATFARGDFEYAGIGMRVEQGLSASAPAAGSLRFYTASNGNERENTLTLMPEGDLEQPGPAAGLVKAACLVDADMSPEITRSFNNLPGGGPITIERLGPGFFEIDFGADVSNRFFSVALVALGSVGHVLVSPSGSTPSKIRFFCADVDGEIQVDGLDFFLTVF